MIFLFNFVYFNQHKVKFTILSYSLIISFINNKIIGIVNLKNIIYMLYIF